MKRYTFFIYLKNEEAKINRTIKIDDYNLNFLAYSIMIAFNSQCDALYSFIIKDIRYVSRIDYPLAHSLDERYKKDEEYILSSLHLHIGDSFIFNYGKNEWFSFVIKVINIEDCEEKELPNIIDGKGYGIYELNPLLLKYYLEVDDDYLYSPELKRKVKREDYLPFNFDDCDIAKINEKVKQGLNKIASFYSSQKEMLPAY